MEKYVLSTALDVVPVDDNIVAVVSSRERFKIKGSNMSVAVKAVIDCFKTPTSADDVIPQLANKYSSATLKKLIDFLINKRVLITEDESNELLKHSEDFLEKAYYYTSGGKPLAEIADALGKLRVGIIWSNQIVNCVSDTLVSGGIIPKPNVFAISKEMDSIVENSDLIIAASNFYDHYTFNQINELCTKHNVKWLRLVVDGHTAEVGPFFIPGKTCCYACLHTRERDNLDEYIFDDLKVEGNPVKFSSLYHLNSIAAGIACSEIMKHFTGLRCSLLNNVYSVNCLDLHTQTDYIYKDYACKVCL